MAPERPRCLVQSLGCVSWGSATSCRTTSIPADPAPPQLGCTSPSPRARLGWGGREPRAQSALAPASPFRAKGPLSLQHCPTPPSFWPASFPGEPPLPLLFFPSICPRSSLGSAEAPGLGDNSPRLTSLPPQGAHPLGGKKDDSVGYSGEWGAWLRVGPAPPSPTQAPPLLGHRGHNKLPGDNAPHLPQLQSEYPHLA